MDSSLVNHYANMADRMARDPISFDQGRATVAMGRGFDKWRRFNRDADLVWVETMDGRMVGLTPWQLKVYQLSLTYIDRGTVTIREMAAMLKCAPSTVSRAMVKLMAWGLLGYLTGRGRYAGTVVFRMVKGDGFDRFRKAAKAKVRSWSEAAQRRLSRLQSNVAPYLLDRERGTDSLYYYLTQLPISKGATLKPWTADELAEIV